MQVDEDSSEDSNDKESESSSSSDDDEELSNNSWHANYQQCLATLSNLLKISHSSWPKSVNALDIPLLEDPFPPQPFSSDRSACNTMKYLHGFDKSANIPLSDTQWALVSTGDTLHPFHIDANGYGTVIQVDTGTKLWFVAESKNGRSLEDFAFKDLFHLFDPDSLNDDLWDLELIVLEPGMRLPSLATKVMWTTKVQTLAHNLIDWLFLNYDFEDDMGTHLTGKNAKQAVYIPYLSHQAHVLIQYKKRAWKAQLHGEDQGLIMPKCFPQAMKKCMQNTPAYQFFLTLLHNVLTSAWTRKCYALMAQKWQHTYLNPSEPESKDENIESKVEEDKTHSSDSDYAVPVQNCKCKLNQQTTSDFVEETQQVKRSKR
ncbi:hypothetical protein C0995_003162 [Termitomyces sp. Mi166|nr:hypothetical protein C0995_003162 [Termitomyces sp. Mi166\